MVLVRVRVRVKGVFKGIAVQSCFMINILYIYIYILMLHIELTSFICIIWHWKFSADQLILLILLLYILSSQGGVWGTLVPQVSILLNICVYMTIIWFFDGLRWVIRQRIIWLSLIHVYIEIYWVQESSDRGLLGTIPGLHFFRDINFQSVFASFKIPQLKDSRFLK
jgi:hypothetical protein